VGNKIISVQSACGVEVGVAVVWESIEGISAYVEPGEPSHAERDKHRGTSRIRNSTILGPYSSPVPRDLWWPLGGGLFLMSVVPSVTPTRPPCRTPQRLLYD